MFTSTVQRRFAAHLLLGVAAAARELGYVVRGACPSPITGSEGNREFFLHLVHGAAASDAPGWEQALLQAVQP